MFTTNYVGEEKKQYYNKLLIISCQNEKVLGLVHSCCRNWALPFEGVIVCGFKRVSRVSRALSVC